MGGKCAGGVELPPNDDPCPVCGATPDQTCLKLKKERAAKHEAARVKKIVDRAEARSQRVTR